jgi:serine/threonine protein kinase
VNERWRQVGELFEAALERDPPERAAWVRALQVDPEVRDEILSLLAAHETAGTFLERSARAETETPLADVDANQLQLLEDGTVVGPYRIIGVIGQGGMGVVYLAEDTRLHRQVALKSLPARLARDERLRQRLRQEARAAAALTHPGIATVFALEELDDQVFIVSEYLHGETLRAEMARGPHSVAHVVATALEIARAMAAAHERGIVHRDLKPENVLRTKSGALKILDFGLAQFEAPARDLASWTRITEPGLVAGTPAYMAPEQLLARPTDARTDHFAFGVLVYELASGRHPFGGASLPSTIAHILTAEPQSPAESDQMGNGLWPIVERCLQKAPADRFASTVDLVRALEETASQMRMPWTLQPASGAVTPAASTAARAIALPDSPFGEDSDASWWWRFHQLAAALVYWSMVWPAWHVRTWLGSPGLLWFLALLACIVVAGNLRIHLWFSSRIYPSELRGQRASVGTWIRWADWGFAALLVLSGLALVQDHTGWGALFVAVGVGTAMAFLFMEPGTARAAFRE